MRTALLVTTLAFSALLSACTEDAPSRKQDTPATEGALSSPGPYGVGTRDFTFTDTSRSTPANGAYPGSPDRILKTSVWYPTDGADASATAPSGAGPFPVVLYAHGFLGNRADVPPLKTHLASHGYVVVAPEFPLSSITPVSGPSTFSDAASQPGDLAFAAAQVKALSGADEALGRALDMTRVGGVGYSLGGTTMLVAAFHPTLHLPELRTAVAYAPSVCSLTRNLYQRSLPTVMLGGSADQLVPFHTLERALTFAKPPVTLVKLVGGTHSNFGGAGTSGASGNDDAFPCTLTQTTLGCGVPQYPELATLLAAGAPGPVFEPSGCGPLCGEKYTQTMSGTRQLELTKAVTLAQLESVLRQRTDAALYLSEALAKTSDAVVVLTPDVDGGPAFVTDAGGCSSASDAGACNAIVNGASIIPTTVVAGATPTGNGGTLVDGTYFLTKVETYTGSGAPSTATWQETIELAGTTAQMVGNDSVVAPFRKTFAVATSGNTITLTATCGTPAVPISSYEATPTSITLYSAALGASRWYTKQ